LHRKHGWWARIRYGYHGRDHSNTIGCSIADQYALRGDPATDWVVACVETNNVAVAILEGGKARRAHTRGGRRLCRGVSQSWQRHVNQRRNNERPPATSLPRAAAKGLLQIVVLHVGTMASPDHRQARRHSLRTPSRQCCQPVPGPSIGCSATALCAELREPLDVNFVRMGARAPALRRPRSPRSSSCALADTCA